MPPITDHRSPITDHRSPITDHRSPFTDHRSLYFASPVVFNTAARTGKPTQLLIPIEGRHADGGLVFWGDKGEWWYGAVRMADPQPLLAALAQMGYLVAKAQPAG